MCTDWVSNSPPMKTWTATAQALIRAVGAVVHGSAKPVEAFEEFVRPQAQARAQARAQATL